MHAMPRTCRSGRSERIGSERASPHPGWHVLSESQSGSQYAEHAGVTYLQKWGAALDGRLRTVASGAERDMAPGIGGLRDASNVDALRLLKALQVDSTSTARSKR